MNSHKLKVNLFELVMSISRIIDVMSPAVKNHHFQVAYMAYRSGMESAEAIKILTKMAENRELDPEIVHTSIRKFDTLDEMRALAQSNAAKQYQEFQTALLG